MLSQIAPAPADQYTDDLTSIGLDTTKAANDLSLEYGCEISAESLMKILKNSLGGHTGKMIRLPEGNDVNTQTSMISAVTTVTGISSIVSAVHQKHTTPPKPLGFDPTNEACSTTQKYYERYPENCPADYGVAAMSLVVLPLLPEESQDKSQEKLPATVAPLVGLVKDTSSSASRTETEALRTTNPVDNGIGAMSVVPPALLQENSQQILATVAPFLSVMDSSPSIETEVSPPIGKSRLEGEGIDGQQLTETVVAAVRTDLFFSIILLFC